MMKRGGFELEKRGGFELEQGDGDETFGRWRHDNTASLK
jgi:hypothetical protein